MHVSNALQGGLTGFCTSVALQPLEIIKMMQIVNPQHIQEIDNPNFLKSFYFTARFIWREEGIKGFYRGLAPACVRFVLSSAIYFSALHDLERIFSKHSTSKDFVNFWASLLAKVASGYMTNPLLVVKSRVELIGFNEYNNMMDGMIKLYKEGGMKAYFKGAYVTALRDGPHAGLWYVIYSRCKRILIEDFNIGKTTAAFTAGMFAGLIATTVTQPFDVIRARLMTHYGAGQKSAEYKGLRDATRRIYAEEGGYGYFKGLFPRLMKKPLSNALSFTLFEVFKKFFAGPEKNKSQSP
jgi:solute carrier family 25 protein 38